MHIQFDNIVSLFTRILVGAPLGQNLQPGTNRSGALWKCPLTSTYDDCEQVVTDGKRSKYNIMLYYLCYLIELKLNRQVWNTFCFNNLLVF